MKYLLLFYEFCKTGLFAVGGGMATLPFLYDMSVRHPDWFTSAQITDMIAVSESTPGLIGVNMATFAGYHVGGVFGGIVATLGLIFPEIIVILLISRVLARFRSNEVVSAVFYGLRPCSVGLIAAAGMLVLKNALLDLDAFRASGALLDLISLKAISLAVLLLVLTRWVKPTKKLHPVFFILFSAVIGIVFHF